MTDAFAIDTAIAEAKAEAAPTSPSSAPAPDPYGSVSYAGKEFKIARKPNALLLAELARVGTGDPEAMGVIAEFFQVTLGNDTYREFKKVVYAEDPSMEDLMGILSEIMELTVGRPTE